LKPFYRTIEHTADIGIEVLAPTCSDIFVRSALALFDMMFGSDSIGKGLEKPIRVEGDNVEELLVAWLNDLLYIYAVDGVIFSGFTDVRLEEGSFSATGLGETFRPERHGVASEIKAATYHGISVAPEGDGWKARVIFDV
jgi:SHS2 domain-containing protein